MEYVTPFLLALFGALVGGGITHVFTRRRDIANKKRETVARILLEAVEAIDRSNMNRPDANIKDLEAAITKIQIFGDIRAIELARNFCNEFVEKRTADTTELLVHLRNGLRRELGLEPVRTGFLFLSVSTPTPPIGKANERETKKHSSRT